MDTFHIFPTDELAKEAVEEVRKFDPDTWIAIRGQEFGGYNENGEYAEYAELYTVSACPDQENPGRYAWQYVQAGEWLAEYESLHSTEAGVLTERKTL